MAVELSDIYEEWYPEHSRTSCSDEHPVNADVDGSGCYRCNAIIFTEHEALRARVAELEKDAERLDWLEKHCTGASDSERYLPFRIYWAQKGVRKTIDAAIEQQKESKHD